VRNTKHGKGKEEMNFTFMKGDSWKKKNVEDTFNTFHLQEDAMQNAFTPSVMEAE
jgi:hypothetical protein